jgi:hypothetical protein
MRRTLTAVGLVTASATAVQATPFTLTVGTDAPTLAAAANIANADGNLANTYDILIPAGSYNDSAFVSRPMTIEATGGPVTLQSVPLQGDKGIIINTSSLTVKGITFSGAATAPGQGNNGAGIRDQSTTATTLRVEGSTFIGNQDGILTSGSGNKETVQIINSLFQNNGEGDGFSHALYVGDALSLLVQNSVFCGTNAGHNVKSRAVSTNITGTQSFDGAVGGGCAGPGSASYGFEFPNGGVVNLDNDTLLQGNNTANFSMIGYGAEGYIYANNTLALNGTSLTSTRDGIGIQHFGATGSCTLTNSPISGPNGFTPVSEPGFCQTVATGPGPTPVNEPSISWLLMTASLGWIVVILAGGRHYEPSPETPT